LLIPCFAGGFDSNMLAWRCMYIHWAD
jgi:hypothetical protein